MPPLLGCIADDFTGATDLASNLTCGGLRTILWLDGAQSAAHCEDADAVVIALKSRSVPPDEASAMSLAALDALKELGVRRYMFKYCSTFDSTERGNIGNVATSLMTALNCSQTVFCPAFPQAGRTMYCGHLFVNGSLLNESGMERHPLNPMTDPNIVRVLQRQSKLPVGLLPYSTVCHGRDAIVECLASLNRQGIRLVVCDALDEVHLHDLAKGIIDLQLITGGSGIAFWLARAYREFGFLSGESAPTELPRIDGFAAVLSGSCSATTHRQLEHFKNRYPMFALDVRAAMCGENVSHAALEWARRRLNGGPFAVYSSTSPMQIEALQTEFGQERTARAVEQLVAAIARGLTEMGVRRLIVAGGETAGAVMQSLEITALRIGPPIDPGVPWVESIDGPHLALALKSGNFGADDFFQRALEMLP